MNITDQISLERTVLGVIMSWGERQAFSVLAAIKREYFTNGANLDIFDSIQDLLKTGTKVDTLTVINQLKKTGKLQGKSVLEISQMTNNIPMMQHQVDTLVSGLIEKHNKRIVGNWLQKHNNQFTSDVLTLEGFIMDFKKLETQIDYGKESDEDIIDVFDAVIHDHDKVKNEDESIGLSLGHAAIIQEVELEPVDVMVVAARPAMGKTAFAISTAKNLCINDGKHVALFVIEMSKKQLVRRLQSNLARVNNRKIRKGTCTEDELHKIRQWRNNANLPNLHIFTGDHRVEDIALKCTQLKNTVGLDLIIIDYVQKVTPSIGGRASETERVKQVADDLKRISQRLEVPQIQFSQLTRTGSAGRPKLSEIKQTTAIEENASIVAFLHRPEYYGEQTMPDDPTQSSKGICEFIIAKNREDESNVIRQFYFEPWYSSFSSNIPDRPKTENKAGEQEDLPF